LLVVSGTLHAPLTVNPAFTGVLLVMSYELGGDILRAVQLAKNLSASEAHLRDTEQRIGHWRFAAPVSACGAVISHRRTRGCPKPA
jgi:hypothetical protein